eukprot:s2162_g8.t1
MPLRLDIKKKLSARIDRVKCVDFHPSEPWTLSALYSGNIFIWDYNTQTLVKQFEVCNLPVRCAKFVTRKQWIATASDDMHIRVFNYNSLEKAHEFEAHTDYIRYIAIHPTLPLWDWDKNWQNLQVFESHAHYVMMCQWNPKDTNIFCSCSLDRSIKVWGVSGGAGGSSNCHFTLTGHQRGVNCVEYSPGGEKPYIISGSDDRTVKIWDYQTKQCIQTLTGHTNNVSYALFHPALPIILTGSEDGTVRIWHGSTYRLEATLSYFLERVWSISVLKGSNTAALGYDEGTVVIKLGSEEPVASMHSGKIIWAKGNEIQTANLKLLDEGVTAREGEKVPLSVKDSLSKGDMGAAEVFPQYIAHHPNGRLFAVCGDGEFVIYTAQALRNKSYGPALEFVWAHSGAYATRDSNGKITVFQDFKESFSFKPQFNVEEIFGGRLLGIRGGDFICFYDWTEYRLVRRIDVVPKDVTWSEDGTNVVLICPDSFYVLRHDKEAVQAALVSGVAVDEDCGVKATTFKDPNDGGLYCYECWIQFYGTPPGPPGPPASAAGAAAAVRSSPVEPDAESDVKGLPEDAPRGHPAHHAVKYQSAKKVFSFQWHGAGGSRIPFQTTVPAARNSRLAAEVIARACYMKFEQGWTKDKILEWRNQCYSRLGGRPPSLLASQAASQRGSGRAEAPARSRSSHRTQSKLAKPQSSQSHLSQVPAQRVAPKDESGKKESARSRSHGEAFLPPNHLKLLLDDPQAALPKSQVKIRSQGVAFSQASQQNFRHSQEDVEKREDIFKSQERPELERTPLVSKQSRGGIVSGPGDDTGEK